MTAAQPAPSAGGPDVVPALVEWLGSIELDRRDDLVKAVYLRRQLGLARYGVELQAFNGRDATRDLVEEIADALCYATQGMLEGGSAGRHHLVCWHLCRAWLAATDQS